MRLTTLISRGLCVGVLLTPLGARPLRAQAGDIVISGRVVDSAQRPVAGALVAIHSSSRGGRVAKSSDGLVAQYAAGPDGRFSIPTSDAPAGRSVLYVTTPVDPDAFTPLSPPFTDLSGTPLIKGSPVRVDRAVGLNVGDVHVSTRMERVTLLLRDSSGARVFSEADEGPVPVLQVRDFRGDVVALGGVPAKAFRRDKSLIVLALPEGAWKLSVSLDGTRGPWHAAATPVDLREPRPAPLKVTVRIEGGPPASTNAGRSISPEQARERLARLGIPYGDAAFVEHAGKCNHEAMHLFLAAGINPNGRDEWGTTALTAAAAGRCGDIVTTLLDAGADPNLANRSMTTALAAASSYGTLSAVDALLSHNADPNAKDGEGLTPVMLASANSHPDTLKTLIRAGANVNAKDNKGMTALDYALETGEQEVIRLLRLHGAKSGESLPPHGTAAEAQRLPPT